jgi:hypothetical protein
MAELQMVQRELEQLRSKTPLSAGLLPKDFSADRDTTIDALAAAAAAILADNMANFQLWTGVQRGVVTQIREQYEALGFEAPPFAWDAFWHRVERAVPPADMQAYVWLIQALLTDYGPRFFQHIAYRMNSGGNVHLSCRGPTGSGKSSCMVALMDWIQSIPRGQLTTRLAFDIHELPRKLGKLGPGSTVLLDEFVGTAGEGSRTSRMILENLEDTLRASQRNLIVASPSRREHSTMQADLECIAWNPRECFSLFLVWVEGIPLGVVALPWCSAEQYGEYKPWKDGNVQRTLAGQFKDNEQTAKGVMELFEDARLVEYLWLGVNKPKMGDFNTAIVLFYPGLLTQAQVERMAKFAYEACYSYQRLEGKFEFFFGVKPNPGFQKIASKCYEE